MNHVQCNDISLLGNWYSIVGLLVRLAVSFLLHHSVDYVCKAVFRLLCHLVGLACSIHFLLLNSVKP